MVLSSPATDEPECETIMILIGQYDSPFVRRGIPPRHAALWHGLRAQTVWSTFGDADKMAPYNPLRRVPAPALDDGEALIKSAMILQSSRRCRRCRQGDDRAERRDAAAAPADLRAGDGARRQGGQSAVRSVLRKEKQLDLWVERCKSQISGVLDVLEKERAAVKTPYWFGEKSVMPNRGRLCAALHGRGASCAV